VGLRPAAGAGDCERAPADEVSAGADTCIDTPSVESRGAVRRRGECPVPTTVGDAIAMCSDLATCAA
jgi:hypothetical protein